MKEDFTAQAAKIVGNAKEGIWAQVATLESLQAVVVISDGEDGKLGREILSLLEEEDKKLEKKNLAELAVLLEKIKAQIPPEKSLSLVLALPVGKVLYLGCLGGAAFLKRGENLEKIVEGQESASGLLNDGDLLILGSEDFFRVMTPQVLAESLNHFAPSEIAERLAPQVSAAEENAGCAALILSFQKEEKKWVEEEAEEEEASEEKGFLEEKEAEKEVRSFSKQRLLVKVFSKIRPFKFRLPNLPHFLSLIPRGENERQKKTLLTVALLLIILLAASIFFGVSKSRRGNQAKKFEEMYKEANFKYEEGKGLVGLNDILARDRLSWVKEQIGQIKVTLSLDSDQEEKIQKLEEGVNESLIILSRVYKLNQLSLFWETSLFKEGSQGDELAIFEDKLAILDRQKRLIYLLSAKTKAVETLGGQDLGQEPKLLGLHGDNVYLLTGGGITGLSRQSKKTQLAIEKDTAWGELISLVAYGGNVYLLDQGKAKEGGASEGQVWKYIGTETGFSSRQEYLASDIKPDFSQARGMAIDGSVWVLLPGQILRFTSGRPDNFVISGLEGDFGQPQAIFTDEKSQNLYLLDPQGKKVLVLGKDGVYQAQYQAEEISQARDLVVSEEEKKIFLLAGGKVYFIEIKK